MIRVRGIGRRVGLLAAIAALLAVGTWLGQAQAQTNNTGGAVLATRAVGGVIIDQSGVIRSASRQDLQELAKTWQQFHRDLPEELRRPSASLAISLKSLDAELARSMREGTPLPEEVCFLGGLTRIDYVLVYPDKQDIIIVGPAEPWRLHEKGYPVGTQTGKPIMLLDDLVVALRAAFQPQRTVISCSIDPTAEGIQRLNAFVRARRGNVDPVAFARALEETIGPQVVTLTGVPESTHFARVLVAADFRMKQISMGAEPAPVPGLPSFVSLVASSGFRPNNMMPRWWLAPDYEPLARDEAGLTWKFQKAAVKTMAEADLYNSQGERVKTEEAAPIYRKWAELMTTRYEELSKADPVFGQVRNCMDLATLGALIAQERLLEKAQLSLPALLGEDVVATAKLTPARHVSPTAVFARIRGGTMFVTGGVQINAWEIVSKQVNRPELAAARASLPVPSGSWFAN
ncbi:MAG: DUF1598 domain-containing protein [Thermogutta sp.]